jgi:hypothetical protein
MSRVFESWPSAAFGSPPGLKRGYEGLCRDGLRLPCINREKKRQKTSQRRAKCLSQRQGVYSRWQQVTQK